MFRQKIAGNKNLECALDVDRSTCSDEKAVEIVAKFIKKKTGKDSIASSEAVINTAKSLTKCSTEECMLIRVASTVTDQESLIIKNNITNNIKLDGPSGTTTWLNNENIDGVIRQLMEKHESVKHIHFQMINFKDHNDELHRTNLLRDVLGKGYKRLCVVLNTDKKGGQGIHWFCIFCDLTRSGSVTDPFTIEYFNSSGRKEPHPVADWCIREKCNIEEKSNYKCNIVVAATVPHQKDTDSECGVYSLYYIHRRLNNEPISTFSIRIPDSVMIEFRKELFKDRISNPAV
jgi:hypothetical protein